MNAGKIRTELYQGKTINQICNTYHMTFKQLFDLLHQTKTVDTEKTPKYILKTHARYFIQKNINGNIKIFGSFYNRKEAEKVLDNLIQHDWELPFHERAGILYVYEKKPDNFIKPILATDSDEWFELDNGIYFGSRIWGGENEKEERA